jgi:hypothetical protein
LLIILRLNETNNHNFGIFSVFPSEIEFPYRKNAQDTIQDQNLEYTLRNTFLSQITLLKKNRRSRRMSVYKATK